MKKFGRTSLPPISLDEFLRDFGAYPLGISPEGDERAALALQQLCLTRDVLGNWALKVVESGMREQHRNPYDVTSFVLWRSPCWMLRANVWYPLNENTPAWAKRAAANIYRIGHNHDQTLISCCFWGPGYQTVTACAVDESNSARFELTPSTTVNFGPGEAIIYDAFRDFHAQLPPDQITVSINLIGTWPPAKRDSKIVDLDSGRVLGSASRRGEHEFQLSKAMQRLAELRADCELKMSSPHTVA